MSTVAIVGAGHVAGATAHALAMSDRVGRLLLVDDAASAARGKALDIRQSGAISKFHTRLEGTDDLSSVTGCDVCVIADRFGAGGEWSGDEGLAMIKRLLPYVGKTPLVFAGASQGGLIAFAATEAGIDRRRLIGSAPEALVSSVVAITALEAGCSPREVMLTVLGAPPSSFVVPWSEGSIGGYPLQAMLSQAAQARVERRLRSFVATRTICPWCGGRTNHLGTGLLFAPVVQRPDTAQGRICRARPSGYPSGTACRGGHRADTRARAHHPRARATAGRAWRLG